MTEFVLEILDGDRAGEIFELRTDPVTFGRRSGNDVVLKDEKCSGRHATVILDDGQWVLRDLESTNGTLLDGRPVDELGLTANDIFQVGVTRVAFKEKGAPTPRNDLSVKLVDQAALARSRRGGGIGLLLVLVLGLGGAAVWYFYLRGDEVVGPVGTTVRKPLQVAGNALTGGDFEAEDNKVFAAVSGVSFTLAFGAGTSHTGTQYLVASMGDEAGATSRHGLARSNAKVTVSAGGAVTASAFMLTTGQARAALRVRFTSSDDERPQLLFTGTTPTQYEDYTEVVLETAVPAGCDQVEVELLALLPDDEATVSVDDVSLVNSRASSSNQLQTSVGQSVTWTGGALQIDDGQHGILLGLKPSCRDPDLASLLKAGLLGLSDVGMQLVVKDEAGAIILQTSGGAGQALTLRFEPGMAANGVLARKGDGPFANHGGRFELTDVDSLLLGYGTSRFLIALPRPGAATGSGDDRAFELTLPDTAEIRLVYDFHEQRDQARNLLAGAQRSARESDFKRVFDQLGTVIDSYPHDDVVAGQAAALRTRIRDELSAAIRRYETLLDEATYFGSLRGYRRIQDQLGDLVARYGREHILQAEQVDALQAKVAASIAAIERENGKEARGKLEVLARVYGDANEEIGALIRNYIKAHLPADDDPPPADAARKNDPGTQGSNKENQ